MEDKDGLIWLDGVWIPWREAKVHLLTHTLHYGCGVFEGLRAYQTPEGSAIFRLRDHTDRLFRSAHIMKMAIPFDKDTLNRAQCEAVSRNHLSSAYIRPMCFLGSEGMGLHAANLEVHVMVAALYAGGALVGGAGAVCAVACRARRRRRRGRVRRAFARRVASPPVPGARSRRLPVCRTVRIAGRDP